MCLEEETTTTTTTTTNAGHPEGNMEQEPVPKQVMKVYCICRYGNDSQLAVRLLKASGVHQVWDVQGGLAQWAEDVDTSFPKY